MQIKPLTPLWTGDAEGKGERVLETGILGSLRWWYEALVRGLGHYACDPGGGTCEYKEKLAGSCPVCQLFGCTGYSRRFRLLVEGGSGAGNLLEVKLSNPGNSNHRGWRIPAIVAPQFNLSFLPMRVSGLEGFEAAALHYTLQLIEQYGALGGKTSQGQGVMKIIGIDNLSMKMDFALWREELARRPADVQGKNLIGAPDLKNLVGATILLEELEDNKVDAAKIWSKLPLKAWSKLPLKAEVRNQPWTPPANSEWLPSSPAIRARLRQLLRETDDFPGFDGDLGLQRHRLMGTTSGKWGDLRPQKEVNRDRPKGSDIFVTHLYKLEGCWKMRIFAFIPKNGNQIDTACRTLLSSPSEMEKLLGQVVGDLSLKAEPYPADIESIFKGGC
ncbi:MAG: hypothetical protein DDT33_01482 [Firmicutes bacterium]|nr:hypothetical protein [Bacillota bacterium]